MTPTPIKLPTKLKKEPMIDAVFEFRFQSRLPVASVLPGALYSALSAKRGLTISQLPNAEMPVSLRQSDPMLAYVPLVRIDWDGYAVQIGDRSVGVVCKMPYPGWSSFRLTILDVIEKCFSFGAVDSVDRVALKYTDLFPMKSLSEAVSSFDWAIRVGKHTLKEESAQLRLDLQRGGYVHSVQIITSAVARNSKGEQLSGAVIDIDSASNTRWTNTVNFREKIAGILDGIHQSNKEVFFDCLAPDLLKSMGAEYEQSND